MQQFTNNPTTTPNTPDTSKPTTAPTPPFVKNPAVGPNPPAPPFPVGPNPPFTPNPLQKPAVGPNPVGPNPPFISNPLQKPAVGPNPAWPNPSFIGEPGVGPNPPFIDRPAMGPNPGKAAADEAHANLLEQVQRDNELRVKHADATRQPLQYPDGQPYPAGQTNPAYPAGQPSVPELNQSEKTRLAALQQKPEGQRTASEASELGALLRKRG